MPGRMPAAGGGLKRWSVSISSLMPSRAWPVLAGRMDRIAEAFAAAAREGRAALVGYLCAGDPDLHTSLEAARVLLRNGVDVLELGVPFSDPLADGLTNQLAAQRALEAGMTQARVMAIVRRLREEFPAAPIVLYTYYNLVFSPGVEVYVRSAAEAGVDGLLTLDLPPEEAGEMLAAAAKAGVRTIFIVAPTTPPERVATIAAAATGFIYYVSREGVTGVRETVAARIPEAVAQVRAKTRLPVAVGFGIARRDQVAEVAAVADGVVVGSVLVNCLARNLTEPVKALEVLAATVRDLRAGTVRRQG